MAKLILKKTGIDTLQLTMDRLAGADKVPAGGTVVMVVGASNKGLGEARISVDSEIARAKIIIDAAKKAKAKILLMHLGGKDRRGQLSDGINKVVADAADYFIVKKDGDEDGFFKAISSKNKKPYSAVAKVGEAVTPA